MSFEKNPGPVASFATVIISIIFAVVISEIGYRSYLYQNEQKRFKSEILAEPSGNFKVADRIFMEFDAVAGYRMLPGISYRRAIFTANKFVGCKLYSINAYGQHSKLGGKAEKGNKTVLILGDSMTSYSWENKTWPSQFKVLLDEEPGMTVNVLNKAVGGIGVLQMFDIAAAEIEKWKPDAIFLVFITDDLDRRRSWKKLRKVGDGQYDIMRVYNKKLSESGDSSWGTSPLIDTRFSNLDCAKLNAAENNSLINTWKTRSYELSKSNILKRARRAVRPIEVFFNLNYSFLFSRLLYGSAYYGLDKDKEPLHKTKKNYFQDTDFIKSLERIRRSKIPFHIVHMPVANELAAGGILLPTLHQEQQLQELKSLNEVDFHNLADFMSHLTQEEIERLAISKVDQHPTEEGLDFYAHAMTRLYLQLQ